jgi:hypothetical protein
MSSGDFFSACGVVGFKTTSKSAVVCKESVYKVMPKLVEDEIS